MIDLEVYFECQGLSEEKASLVGFTELEIIDKDGEKVKVESYQEILTEFEPNDYFKVFMNDERLCQGKVSGNLIDFLMKLILDEEYYNEDQVKVEIGKVDLGLKKIYLYK